MTQEEELDVFVEKWGGRTLFFQLLEQYSALPEKGDFVDELGMLLTHNAIARTRIANSLRVIAGGGQLGDAISTPFQGTCETHGSSTADDFFKAKSPSYLLSAEAYQTIDEMVLNNEEGWSDSGKDVGDL